MKTNPPTDANLAKPDSANTAAFRHGDDAIEPADIINALASIATNAWKAQNRLVDPKTGEPHEETKRIHRHIESILDSLGQIQVQVKDHTGEVFDYGLPLTVVTTQPTRGIDRERVIETIKPTVYWKQQMIQAGEVVIVTPV